MRRIGIRSTTAVFDEPENRFLRRGKPVGVTLYSKPNYRGLCQTLPCADPQSLHPRTVCSLADIGLPRIGSVKIQRFTHTSRPMLQFLRMEAREDFWPAVVRMLAPGSWHVFTSLPLQSWVRLWADEPSYPPAQSIETADPADRPWHDILTNTPDVGPWSTRTRYVEFGMGRVSDFEDMRQ